MDIIEKKMTEELNKAQVVQARGHVTKVQHMLGGGGTCMLKSRKAGRVTRSHDRQRFGGKKSARDSVHSDGHGDSIVCGTITRNVTDTR